MEKNYTREGRFIPSVASSTMSERLHAVEVFLMRFSEEMEYALTRLNESVAAMTEQTSNGEEVDA